MPTGTATIEHNKELVRRVRQCAAVARCRRGSVGRNEHGHEGLCGLRARIPHPYQSRTPATELNYLLRSNLMAGGYRSRLRDRHDERDAWAFRESSYFGSSDVFEKDIGDALRRPALVRRPSGDT
jgi:hypothetical protein